MATTASTALERDLKTLLGEDAVLPGNTRTYLTDATESRNLRGRADAVVLPNNAEAVQKAVAWCYDHDVAIIPRGGGTRLHRRRRPARWRSTSLSLEKPEKNSGSVDPGIVACRGPRPGMCHRRPAPAVLRENGLLFPPDPGAAEQSQIGGNIATNAGGPARVQVRGDRRAGSPASRPCSRRASSSASAARSARTSPATTSRRCSIGSEGTLGIDHRGVAAARSRRPRPRCRSRRSTRTPQTGCAAIARRVRERPAARRRSSTSTQGARGVAVARSAASSPRREFMVLAEADGTDAGGGPASRAS